MYPSAALAVPWGSSISWSQGEYLPEGLHLPERNVEKGSYISVELEFHTDDRPQKYGGTGYVIAWLQGLPWFKYVGPTLHPDQVGPHFGAFGWYQWQSRPTEGRTIWWLTNELHYKKP